MQACQGKTESLESTSKEKVLEDLTSTITRVLLESALSKASPTELEDLTNTFTSILLESALSKASMQGSPVTQDECDHGAPPEETGAPSSATKEVTPADRELLYSVFDVLGAYASKHNLGPEIAIGPQPTRDLTISTPELFNSLGVVLLTYAQTHEGWGTCDVDDSCTYTW